jgi:hypothetical protein
MGLHTRDRKKSTGPMKVPFNCPGCSTDLNVVFAKGDGINSISMELEGSSGTESELKELVADEIRQKMQLQMDVHTVIKQAMEAQALKLIQQFDTGCLDYELSRPITMHIQQMLAEVETAAVNNKDKLIIEEQAKKINRLVAVRNAIWNTPMPNLAADYLKTKSDNPDQQEAKETLAEFLGIKKKKKKKQQELQELQELQKYPDIFFGMSDWNAEVAANQIQTVTYGEGGTKVDFNELHLEFEHHGDTEDIWHVMKYLGSWEDMPDWFVPTLTSFNRPESFCHSDGSVTQFTKQVLYHEDLDGGVHGTIRRVYHKHGWKIRVDVVGDPGSSQHTLPWQPKEWQIREMVTRDPEVDIVETHQIDGCFACADDLLTLIPNFCMILKNVGTGAFPLQITHYDGTYSRFECALGNTSEDEENIFGDIVEIVHNVYQKKGIRDYGWKLMSSCTTNVRDKGE